MVTTIVTAGLALVAAVMVLVACGLSIGGVLVPVAMAVAIEPRTSISRGNTPARDWDGRNQVTDDGLTPEDLAMVKVKEKQVRENVRRRHDGVMSAGQQDGRAGLVMVDVQA